MIKNQEKGVFLRVTGLNFSRLIETMAKAGIVVKRVRRTKPKELEFWVSEHDHKKLVDNGILKDYQAVLVRSWTRQDAMRSIFLKSGIVLGIVFACLIFLGMSKFVFSVEIVRGGNHVCQNGEKCIFEPANIERLENYLEALGVHVGARVDLIDKAQVERQVLSKFDELSSVEIKISGTKVMLELFERVKPTPEKPVSFDLIAPENGIVQKLVVSAGKAKVKAGDTVKKGQVLIAGENGQKAMGSAVMKLALKASSVHSEVSFDLQRTGKYKILSYYTLMGQEIGKVSQSEDPGFVFFEKEETSCYIASNLFVPLKKIMIKYYELEKTEVQTPIDDVKDKIVQELSKKLEKMANLSTSEPRTFHTVVTEIASGVFEIDCYVEYVRIVKQ